MAAAQPAKKSSAKKAAAKKAATKAVAKKAATKSTAKKAAAKSTARKTTAKKASAKRASQAVPPPLPPVPPAPTEAPELPPVASPPEIAGPERQPVHGGSAAATYVERFLALDWALTARIAVPTFLTLFAAACVVTSSLLLLPKSATSVGGFSGAGGYFHGVAMIAAMVFGSGTTVHGSIGEGSSVVPLGDVAVMPLTVTILVLVVFASLCRRYVTGNSLFETAGALVRSSLVFALLAMGLSFFAHTSFGSSDSDEHITVGASPAVVFGYALVLTLVIGSLTVFGPTWLARLRRGDETASRWGAWRLSIEGGLVAVITSVVVGGLIFVVLMFADQSSGHPPASFSARALPVIAGLFVNIGVAVTAFAMGANVGLTGSGVDSQASIGYAHLHGLSSWYFLLLLLPVIAIGAGVAWMLHRRAGEDDRAMSRACYRMAASYALGWLILGMFSRASAGTGLLGGVHVGPQLLLGFGLALGWALVLGVAFGQLLLARGMPSVRLAVPRVHPPSWQRVSVLALVVIVALAVVDIATGGAPSSAATNSGSQGVAIARPAPLPAPAVPLPPITPLPAPSLLDIGDVQAQGILSEASGQEAVYRGQHGSYTRDSRALNLFIPNTVTFAIVRADSQEVCMTARSTRSGNVYSYDSATGSVVAGDTC